MARLWSSGFELNSTSSGVELTSGEINTSSIQTSLVRTGTYAHKINGLTSGNADSLWFDFKASPTVGPFYFRAYFRVDTLPTADCAIIEISSGAGGEQVLIYLSSTGTLKLKYDEFGIGETTVGSPSSALSVSTWYRIELLVDRSGGDEANVLRVKLDDTEFASTTNATISNNFATYRWGGNLTNLAQTQGVWYFDDLAINDSTGSFQNTYPGAGSILHLRPNGTGDDSAWGGTYTDIDEVTPDDNTTKITANINPTLEYVNIDDTPSAIAAGDVINLVQVGARYNGAAASLNAGFQVGIKASSGGTIEESAIIIPANTTWTTNANSVPKNYALTLYDLPGASTTAWTKATLDTAQIGVDLASSNLQAVQVSTLWLLVEYVPGSPVVGSGTYGSLPIFFQ